MKAVVITGSGMGAEISNDPSTAVRRQPMIEQTLDAIVSNAGVDNVDPIR